MQQTLGSSEHNRDNKNQPAIPSRLPHTDLLQPQSGYVNLLASESLPALRGVTPPVQKVPERPWPLGPILQLIEKPWAPALHDLPAKKSPEHSGNSPLPFRAAPQTADEARQRAALLRHINAGMDFTQISGWSSIYSYSVPVANLPAAFRDFSILHISDIHFEKSNPRPILELQNLCEWLRKNNVRVDAIMLSGDIITAHPDDLSEAGTRTLGSLRKLASSAFFVLGNHDYHGFKEHEISRKMFETGYLDLTNASSRIIVEDSTLNLYGTDDAIFGTPECPKVAHPKDINLLMTHNLDAVRSNFPDNFDLVLSGHTHWGEIKYLDGVKFMGLWGYANNINNHSKGWDMLTGRALSFVHPGLARHYIKTAALRHPPGFVLHRLCDQK